MLELHHRYKIENLHTNVSCKLGILSLVSLEVSDYPQKKKLVGLIRKSNIVSPDSRTRNRWNIRRTLCAVYR